jgi:hypothetical protein
MKQKVLCTFGLIVLVMVASGTIPAAAQTTALGPYYATPSWDQKLQCDTPATCPRFIVLSDWYSAAVLDRETGLVWQRSLSTIAVNWYQAQESCNVGAWGGRMGWRLPTLQELASLVDYSRRGTGLALPAGHPFQNVQANYYWSATTSTASIQDPQFLVAWIVGFRDGTVSRSHKDVYATIRYVQRVWCVRGGQGVDPQ